MHFSFHPKGQWSLINEKATEIFGVNEIRNQVRVYSNCSSALLELSLGFFQQFPLKRKFFYFKNLDPHFDLAVTALSKMGFQAKALEISDMSKPEAWQDQLDREAGFFLYSYDNPVTGALHPITDLDRILKEKGIFRITLSHSEHLSLPSNYEPDRNEIQVRQMPFYLCRGVALAYVGERGRFGAIAAEANTPCDIADLLKLKTDLERLAEQKKSWAIKVETHEKFLASSFNLHFKDASQARSRDRIVISLNEMDGHAFLDRLASTQDRKLGWAGQDARFETSSLSRWGGLKTMDWLKGHGLSSDEIRGLVILYPSYFDSRSPKDLHAQLVDAKSQVLRLQNGEAVST